jgi:shikimate kinase
MRPENRDALAGHGPVVWLRARPETLWQRIAGDATTAARRPNLTGAGGITEIIATLAAREPIYRQCAALEVDTEGKTPEAVAGVILDQLQLA